MSNNRLVKELLEELELLDGKSPEPSEDNTVVSIKQETPQTRKRQEAIQREKDNKDLLRRLRKNNPPLPIVPAKVIKLEDKKDKD